MATTDNITRRLFLKNVPPALTVGAAISVPAVAAQAAGPSEIEKLFREWQAGQRRFDFLHTDEDVGDQVSACRKIELAMLELNPTSARDVALQYLADTNFDDYMPTDEFKQMVRRVFGEERV